MWRMSNGAEWMWRMSERSECGEYLMRYLFAFGKKKQPLCVFVLY